MIDGLRIEGNNETYPTPARKGNTFSLFEQIYFTFWMHIRQIFVKIGAGLAYIGKK